MSGFLAVCLIYSCLSDRLQFTVTSRKEMPNARFVEELARAADDLQVLFESESKKSKL